MFGDDIVAGALADLQRREGHHREPDRRRVEHGPPSLDHTVPAEPVEPGLDGATRHTEASGRLEHSDPRLVGEQAYDIGIKPVNGVAHHLSPLL
jgi:hypothetical protein